ncbi:ATP-binding protein [Sphingobacterium phlebotomi]|uniref:ATP-binding protein n=1 Tax=Sphingobacterium phlebotomi TaxID=2605433 RepID=A0A5D4H6G5_9SPHI|nr:ATP-binding protein [Sphingobacterium phlebotomi]TYR35843.1 ATP-binding protein [Sphingobacterium phlebotomi]
MKNSTKITNASIESAGLPKDAKQVIAEYVWNGFDAKATVVAIDITSNQLGYIEQISISDNGEGIAPDTLDYSFGNFLDSLKKGQPKRTSYTRGKKGKGRFAFSLFATRATWYTVVATGDSLVQYKLVIDRDAKEEYDNSEPQPSTALNTGTTVVLEGVFGLNAMTLLSEEFVGFLAQEFGWFLHLNKDMGYSIKINGKPVSYQQLIQETDETSFTIYSPEENSFVFKVNYIRWKYPIGDRYYYYFLNSHKAEVAKLLSSFNNNAIDFHHSVYVESSFFNGFEMSDMMLSGEGNLFSEKEQQVVYRKLLVELRDMLERKQKKYVRDQAVDIKLQELVQKDLLPHYSSSDVDRQRKVTLLQLVQELYIADPRAFVGVKADLIRTYLGFLDLLLQTDRKNEILPIVERAIPLSDKERERIVKILK